ncbi:50S ribosomal protein L9 [Taylorella asinigenitalis 14/45]|uniref:Large ribosomal subunit protein bL9 n=2 Tax=Taylorella asinigenitalis TaxID=84590 RepID=G4Q9U9_TAYAM|nr:50S ribosomal protein L9 [Taylorella asinigenitalis]AEP36868.1 LSU ribosomal protein L9p [Taylorella asinigenitalis MCE3]CCG19093.1 50S ribosomal protein L9 [Taylorella asinigenitalis 14/45]
MQVILLEKIGKLGDLGEVVKVRDGYARNYLIPQHKARRATKEAIAEFETRRAELEKQQAERLAQAQSLGEKLNGYRLEMPQKAGVDGRLFGSVTSMDIASALSEAGFAVTKQQVRLPQGSLKAVGEYEVSLHLHADVDAVIVVNVIGEMV